VIVSGGMQGADHIRWVFEHTGCAAVMLARGALGNPWLFAELVHGRSRSPTRADVVDELDWTIERAVEHLGEARATRYLRKFYPWYVARMRLDTRDAKQLQSTLQQADTLALVRDALQPSFAPAALAV
jgi:tRNA-dihydrouridine synthase B